MDANLVETNVHVSSGTCKAAVTALIAPITPATSDQLLRPTPAMLRRNPASLRLLVLLAASSCLITGSAAAGAQQGAAGAQQIPANANVTQVCLALNCQSAHRFHAGQHPASRTRHDCTSPVVSNKGSAEVWAERR